MLRCIIIYFSDDKMKYLFCICLLIIGSLIACDNFPKTTSQDVLIQDINNKKQELYQIIDNKAIEAGELNFSCGNEVRKFKHNWEDWLKDYSNDEDFSIFLGICGVYILNEIFNDIDLKKIGKYAKDNIYDLCCCLDAKDNLDIKLESVFWQRVYEVINDDTEMEFSNRLFADFSYWYLKYESKNGK